MYYNDYSQATILTKNALNEQLNERLRKEELLRINDKNYADNVHKKIEIQEALEKQKREKQQLEMKRYREALEKQIDDTNRRKLYKDVMSEHERKVNGLELDAYEKMDMRLHTKLVGAKDISELPPSPPKPPHTNPNPPTENIKGAPVADYELIKKFNMVDNVMRKEEPTYQPTPEYENPSRIVKLALRNMLDPRVSFMRNNTHNKIYGYKGEPFYKYGLNNSVITMPSENAEMDKKAADYYNGPVINPLSNAGKSQVFDTVATNAMPKESYNRKPVNTICASSDNIYGRYPAPGRQRYANYNMMAGGNKSDIYS